MRRISVLGATGSVGMSTLDIIGRDERFEVVALSAQTNAERLADLAMRHRADLAVIGDPSRYEALKSLLAGTGIEAAAGENAVVEAASRPADCVMAAIVGAAGLKPTFAAARQGRRVALANKECLVSAGRVFMDAVRSAGGELLPVDSEHSAAFQAIGDHTPSQIERIELTASGGPFRTLAREAIARARPEEALRHPNWSMGQKITIDSATMMNKGLEVIEAHHLFGVEPERIGVLVHPQSIVHCLVHFADGSVIAQLSAPDMRTPIAYSLSWPRRMAAPTARLDLAKVGALTFEAPDLARFPALALARQALARGGTAAAVLNAANEIAVEAYLAKMLSFYGITDLVADCLDMAEGEGVIGEAATLEEVLAADASARRLARGLLVSRAKRS
jgi:1-deoxy-D-xylulose-5-phosphate reductoisomerase